MSSDLRQGFRFGPWTVEPLRGAVTGPNGEAHHLEPKVMDVFVYLAEHSNRVVTRVELLDSVWRAQEVTDEPLTRAIGALRRALDVDRDGPSLIETVPKRGYRLNGNVAALARAGEGTSQPKTVAGKAFPWPAFAVVLVIVVAAAVFIYAGDREPATVAKDTAAGAGEESAIAASRRSVAVLPFRNRSAAEEDAYFVDGIHDDIITQLAKIDSIEQVISRTTMERYRDTDKSLPEIGRELGVATVLEGGIQRSGENVRINVQLIDAAEDEHLWAETYDRRTTAGNIFAIQSEIAKAVADQLQLTLTADDRERIRSVPTQNLTALENYFRAKDLLAKRTTAEIDKAIALLEATLDMDPDFVLAHVSLANALELKMFYSGAWYEELLPRAKALTLRAIELDPHSDEAWTQLGSLESGIDNDAAEEAYRKAIELNPNNANALRTYCDFLGPWQGRNEDALPLCERGAELDPLSPIMLTVLGQTYSGLGRSADAEAAYRKSIAIDADFAYGYANLGYLYRYAKGEMQEAGRWFRRAVALDPGATSVMAALGNTYIDLGDPDTAKFWIDHALRLAPSSVAPNVTMAVYSSVTGDYELAAEFARKANENELPEFAGYAMTPIRDYEIMQGRIANARDVYARIFPEFLSSEHPEFTSASLWAAADFAYVLMLNGEEDDARLLAERLFEYIESRPRLSALTGYGPMDAIMHAILGDRDKAIASLQLAVDEGWRFFWRFELKNDLSLESIRDDPRFQAIVARIEADMAAQLAELREWEANGELAPIPSQLQIDETALLKPTE